MSDPYQECVVCHRRRNCMLHRRAEFPPKQAKAWLLRTCADRRAPRCCDIVYRAGIGLAGPLTGQEVPHDPA